MLELSGISPGEHRATTDIFLQAGGVTLSGLITGEHGVPVAHARVRAYRDRGASFGAFSGGDGKYQLSVEEGYSYQIEVTHDDYRRAWANISTVSDQITVSDFKLIRGSMLRGRVLLRDSNTPIGGAEVNAYGGREYSIAHTAADGTFTLRGLDQGEIKITARGRGYATVEPSTVELAAGEHVEPVLVFVDPAFAISGRVVAKDDASRGLIGVTVSAVTPGDDLWPIRTETDSHGEFEIVGLHPAKYHLVARPGVEGGIVVDIVDADVGNVTITLPSAANVSGRVYPPAVAQILLTRSNGFVNLPEARTESDARGVFNLRDVRRGEYEVTAMSTDGQTGKVAVAVADTDVLDLRIELSPTLVVSGRVVDTNGKAVVGVYVFGTLADLPIGALAQSGGPPRGVQTALDGTFRLAGLTPDVWRLSVTMPKVASIIGSVEIDLSNGVELRDVTISVDAFDANLHGVVLGVDGKPMGAIQVQAMRELEGARPQFDSQTSRVRTDASGNFTFVNLRSGTYTLLVEGPGGASRATVRGVRSGDNVIVDLQALSTLSIVVGGFDAAKVKAQISCRGPVGVQTLEASTDDVHTFVDVAQGEWRCEAISDEVVATGAVNVGSAPAKLVLSLAPYATVTGVAVDALTGKPVSTLTIAARGTSTLTDVNGNFELKRVRPGSDNILVMGAGQLGVGHETIPYTARPGERVSLGRIKVASPRTGDVGTFGLSLGVQDAALIVLRVRAGTPAQRAGILVGDTITSLDDQSVATIGVERAKRLLASDSVGVGQTVDVTLLRGVRVRITAVRW